MVAITELQPAPVLSENGSGNEQDEEEESTKGSRANYLLVYMVSITL